MRVLAVLALLAVLPPAAILASIVAMQSSSGWLVVVVGLAAYYLGLAWLVWSRRTLLATGVRRLRERRAGSDSPGARSAPPARHDGTLTLAELRASTKLSRSTYGLQLLASRATGGTTTLDELRTIATLHGDDPHGRDVELLWPPFSANSALALVDVLVALRDKPVDLSLAIAILERIDPDAGADDQRLDGPRQLRLPTLLLEHGERDRALTMMSRCRVPDMLADQVRADILNPFLTSGDAPADDARITRWLIAANRVIAQGGLEPISLIDTPAHVPFDRLTSSPRSAVTHDDTHPLVSIVMTTFRPGREAISAVRSVLSQSWGKWELLVIDDASGEDYAAILDEIEGMDARISVHRRSHNAGTYVCRNVALDAAHGDLVTVLDADDWMHPRRLELQVVDLLSNPEQLANVSNTLRVTQDLGFLHDRGPGIKLCEPAMMYRRRELIDRVGYYHEARKGADSELRWRINAIQGFPVRHLTALPPLTLQRFDTGSLSGGDFVRGWVHPARVSYRSAWWEWHRQHRQRPDALRLTPGAPSPFPSPAHMSGRPREEHELDRDVVLIVDASDRASAHHRQKTALRLTSELRSLGLTVGIMHVWTMGEIPGGHLIYSPAVQAIINSGQVVEVFAGDELNARLAVALSDAEITVMGALPQAWKQTELVVLSGERRDSPRSAATTHRRLNHAELLRAARKL